MVRRARSAALAALLLLASCDHPRDLPAHAPPPPPGAAAAAERAGIDLRVTFVTPVDARARAACEAGIGSVLRHHGFVLDPAGTPIAVEVVLLYDLTANTPPGAMDQGPLPWNANAPARSPADAASTAELTARIGPYGVQSVIRTAGAAQGLACDAAAERLAAVLAGALGRR